MLKIAAICLLLAAVVYADLEKTDDDFTAVEDLEATARFAFITVNSDGSVSFTFNATSLQYTLLAGGLLLGLGVLLLPLLGLLGLIGKKDDDSGEYGYGYADPTQGAYSAPPSTGYGPAAAAAAATSGYPSRSSYSAYAKRSLSWMAGPIMQALEKTYRKYEAEHHED